MKASFLFLGGIMLLSACAQIDPYTRAGVWRPNGSNDTNLRAMIADPDDLVVGAADGLADAQVVGAAVARYRSGRVKDLGDGTASRISPITVNTGGAAASSSSDD